MLFRTVHVVVVLSLVGCYASHERRLPSLCGRRIQVETTDAVDLLFLVDNSNSMAQEQDLLRAEIPRMIAVLAGGDRDRDGVPDFVSPIRSLHVGVITPDMGSGDPPPFDSVPTCMTRTGDDGILRSVSTDPTCDPEYPSRIFDFEHETGDPAEFARVVGCVANLGTGGCGFEQQLEAVLKALSPSRPTDWVARDYTPPAFVFGTGHGDGENAGFLRDGSVLAIVTLTDEEDCSVPDHRLFYTTDPTYRHNPLNLRCSRFPEALFPTERYVEGLLQLREDPSLLVWAPIVGVPPDLVGAPWDVVLSDPRLAYVERIEASGDRLRLEASCESEVGEATPPRRFIEVARELELRGAIVTMESICQNAYRSAVDRVLARVEEASRGSCLPVPLAADADGRVQCDLLQLLSPPGTPGRAASCDELGLFAAGYTDVYGTRREVCRVPQLVPPLDPEAPPTEAGFYYDDRSESAGACDSGRRLAIVGLRERGEMRLSCDQSSSTLEAPCTADASCGPSPAGTPLSCDPLEGRCKAECTTDADCAEAGLLSYRCDRRSSRVVADALGLPLGSLDPSAPYGRCVNPSCD